MTIRVSGLYSYPIKSCAGISHSRVDLDKYGIVNDRSFLVIGENGVAITQRDVSRLALVRVELKEGGIVSLQMPGFEDLNFERKSGGQLKEAKVWSDTVETEDQGDEAASWFSAVCARSCRLVSRSKNYKRLVNEKYIENAEEVSFADGFPLLLISDASLEDLNSKLEVPVLMNRFRPNIVVSGSGAYAEDSWKKIRINGLSLSVVKPCARCVMVSIEQESAIVSKEPLRTLSLFRKVGEKVMFGQNLLHKSAGQIKVGDELEVLA